MSFDPGEFGRGRISTLSKFGHGRILGDSIGHDRVSLHVGEFDRGRIWRWASLDVGEVWTLSKFGHGRVWTLGNLDAREFERWQLWTCTNMDSKQVWTWANLDVGEFGCGRV